MKNEILKIFDEDQNAIGTATRAEIHKMGYWHEVFHCWFIGKEAGIDYIYLQLRSEKKQDYPNLFDITAAGHLLAEETVYDGIREIKEELGIDVCFSDLVPLGMMPYSNTRENFIDRELANIFLYEYMNDFHAFVLQEEEVSWIARMSFQDFRNLWSGNLKRAKVTGIKLNRDGNPVIIDTEIGQEQFVPHEKIYYDSVIRKISNHLHL